MKVFAILAFVLVCAAPAWSKIFTKCELAKELLAHGIAKSEIPNWICLVQHESGFNTKALGALNSNGTRDYGLFQINNRYWCQGSIESSNLCHIKCDDLLSDNITAALNCAKLIKERRGGTFEAWYGWLNYCQKSLPSVSECF
ncbi:unnamed protein product [Hermetia illucens]|uniref:lysozyme n=1 Tax=Hermetia illucens TaxID=343691 RepID=A0A7R8UXH6_HERIL|nr:lysozyme 1-like [Hermetia illucens]CAD7088843.1 unnamed protein product [Hermetia illucens]